MMEDFEINDIDEVDKLVKVFDALSSSEVVLAEEEIPAGVLNDEVTSDEPTADDVPFDDVLIDEEPTGDVLTNEILADD